MKDDKKVIQNADEETSSGADLTDDSEDETEHLKEQTPMTMVCTDSCSCLLCLLESCLALFNILCLLYFSLT